MRRLSKEMECPGCHQTRQVAGNTLGMQALNNTPLGMCKACTAPVARAGITYKYFLGLIDRLGLEKTKKVLHLAKTLRYNAIYRDRHKKRGQLWKLTTTQTVELIVSPCAYCGIESVVEKALRTQIDKVVPKKGYIVGNVVPCCRFHNGGKNSMTLPDFCRHFNQNAVRTLSPKQILKITSDWAKKLKGIEF